MSEYTSTINVSRCAIGDLESLLEHVRAIGSAEFDADRFVIVATFTVGDDGMDLWDLYVAIDELNAQLEGYGADAITEKPQLTLEWEV